MSINELGKHRKRKNWINANKRCSLHHNHTRDEIKLKKKEKKNQRKKKLLFLICVYFSLSSSKGPTTQLEMCWNKAGHLNQTHLWCHWISTEATRCDHISPQKRKSAYFYYYYCYCSYKLKWTQTRKYFFAKTHKKSLSK
jgi:hypothetical protein